MNSVESRRFIQLSYIDYHIIESVFAEIDESDYPEDRLTVQELDTYNKVKQIVKLMKDKYEKENDALKSRYTRR